MPAKETFAAINASLNGLSLVLLLLALVLIKRRQYAAHGWTMATAIATSSLFLVCYLVSKAVHGERSSGMPPGWYRFVYLYIVLFPHLILAMAVVPMVVVTVFKAWTRNWPGHRSIAPWTYGIWLYVSVTGVLIYFMLYRWAPQG